MDTIVTRGLSDPAPSVEDMNPTISERDRAMLSMERQWWQFAGVKEQRIREEFDCSATRYYQDLNALIDRDDVLAHDPLLVKRLRRLRAQRQRSRSPRRLGIVE